MSEDHYKDQNAQTALQNVLSTLWASSLGIERVGIEDDFFELGGASVVATQIVSRLRQMFQMDLPAILLFETPTIEKLAQYIDRTRGPARSDRKDRYSFEADRKRGMTEGRSSTQFGFESKRK